VILQVQANGFVIASSAGDRIEIPKSGDTYDMEQLREKLQERKRLEPNRKDLVVAPEDGVQYKDVVASMDMVVGEGFPDMSLSDGSSL
jgi:biopolymer transport protein ExbD